MAEDDNKTKAEMKGLASMKRTLKQLSHDLMTHSPLLTDLYQLTMIQGYLGYSMTEIGVFEFSVRKMSKERKPPYGRWPVTGCGFLGKSKIPR